MQYLSRPELLHVMHTCKALYELGIPPLLRTVKYKDFGPPCNNFYCHFLPPDSTRFTHVTHLECHVMGISTSLHSNFIRLSTRTEDLKIKASRSSSITSDDVNQIARLSCLRHLRLVGQLPVVEILQGLTVPLTSLSINTLSIPCSGSLSARSLCDPISSIKHLSGSLEEFRFDLHTCADVRVAFTAGYSFPAMRKVEWSAWHPIDIGAVASTFPNLDSLSIVFYGAGDDYLRHYRAPPPLSLAQMAVIREQSEGVRQWDVSHRFQYLKGSVNTLWTLGIRCQAKLLDIYVTNQEISEAHIRELLADAQPVHLRLSLSSDFSDGFDTLPGHVLAYDTVEDLELKFSVVEFQLEMMAAKLVRLFC